MHDSEAYIICNGYKDEEFIDLALHSQKMGLKVMLVLEMPSELDLILERSRRIGVLPNQPPFPRPPFRPNGCFRRLPPKANS
jgi:arginine decarboxylase